MRRIAIALTLATGCFGEPTDDHVATTAVVMTTAEPDESSSDGGSSSEGEASSSGEAPFDPSVCPEWCSDCDVVGVYLLCRCNNDLVCQQDTSCEGFQADPYRAGHCQ